MLLGNYLSDWLILKQASLKPKTIESYRYVIRHINAHIGSMDVDKLTAHDITHALAQIAIKHSRTAEMCYVLLRAALSDIDSNPMQRVIRPRHVQTSPEAWTDDQIALYISALPAHRHQIPLLLAIALGLRRGEICGLRWTDIDFASETMHVCNQRQRFEDGSIVDCPPKSITSDRVIPIPASVMRILRQHRQLSGYVTALTPYGLDAAHRALVRCLALPPIPLHGLRHSFATACVRHGGSMKALQVILGHSSYAVTANRYTHPDMQMLRNAIDVAQVI